MFHHPQHFVGHFCSKQLQWFRCVSDFPPDWPGVSRGVSACPGSANRNPMMKFRQSISYLPPDKGLSSCSLAIWGDGGFVFLAGGKKSSHLRLFYNVSSSPAAVFTPHPSDLKTSPASISWDAGYPRLDEGPSWWSR